MKDRIFKLELDKSEISSLNIYSADDLCTNLNLDKFNIDSILSIKAEFDYHTRDIRYSYNTKEKKLRLLDRYDISSELRSNKYKLNIVFLSRYHTRESQLDNLLKDDFTGYQEE